MGKFETALKNGSEIVVVDSDCNCDSAVFWWHNGVFYSFNRSFGVVPRSDLSINILEEHLNNMLSENASIFIRGYRN